jgi:hypothetical protein
MPDIARYRAPRGSGHPPGEIPNPKQYRNSKIKSQNDKSKRKNLRKRRLEFVVT